MCLSRNYARIQGMFSIQSDQCGTTAYKIE